MAVMISSLFSAPSIRRRGSAFVALSMSSSVMTFWACAGACFLEVRATAPRDCSVPVAVGSGDGGATGDCWATQTERKNQKAKARSQFRPKPAKVVRRLLTRNGIGRPKPGKDDQSFRYRCLPLPAVSMPQAGDMGDVMPAVPGVERQILL